jgi:hypothetical protein
MDPAQLEQMMRDARPAQQVKRTTIVHLFSYQVHELPDGGRQVDIVTPDAEIIALPLSPAAAADLAARLTAPRAAAVLQ